MLPDQTTNSPRTRMQVAGDNHPGRVRETNQDAFLLEPVDGEEETWLAVVVDGMGGERGGEEAARLTIEGFRSLLARPLPQEQQGRYEWLMEGFRVAQESILDVASQDFFLRNMGATAVAALVTPTEVLHLYAGDCRFYHFQAGSIQYTSRDHSVIRLLLESGRITPEEVAGHSMRSVVTSSLGGGPRGTLTISPQWPDSPDEPSPFRSLQPKDIILLCSDGLYKELTDDHLVTLVQEWENDPKLLLVKLLDAALAAGGEDNATLIVMGVNEGEGDGA